MITFGWNEFAMVEIAGISRAGMTDAAHPSPLDASAGI
jgi:hypothetical protein